MKKLVTVAFLFAGLIISCTSNAQEDKSKRPSPPALVKQEIASGAIVSIDYSQPAVKGRTIGKDLEPKDGQVWRTGANEATVFETTKAIKVNGAALPAGRYGLFTISGEKGWTVIFNKTWKQWGAYDYKEADDFLRILAVAEKAPAFTEKMTFTIDANGTVTLFWGDVKVSFTAE